MKSEAFPLGLNRASFKYTQIIVADTLASLSTTGIIDASSVQHVAEFENILNSNRIIRILGAAIPRAENLSLASTDDISDLLCNQILTVCLYGSQLAKLLGHQPNPNPNPALANAFRFCE
jgi:hypothetical protein